jgi:hypothetical protein
MRGRDEHKRIARTPFPLVAGVLSHTDRVLAAAERWLRPFDRLDYAIRRQLIPVRFEEETRSAAYKETPIRRSGLSSDTQQAIGQQLRTRYTVERSMPTRLTNLLREFEQRSNGPDAGRSYASAA